MLRRRRSFVGLLALALVVLSIGFVACGPPEVNPSGSDGGKKDGGDNPPISGTP